MEKTKLRFFLDYGACFWDAGIGGLYTPEQLPLTPETQHQINQFLRDFDQCYFCSCPPSEGWTVEDCKRFNTEMWRIFKLAESELKDQYVICHEQPELMEDEEQLAEFYRDVHAFQRIKVLEYYGPDEDEEN